MIAKHGGDVNSSLPVFTQADTYDGYSSFMGMEDE